MFNVAYRNLESSDLYNDILLNNLSKYRALKIKKLKNELSQRQSIGAELLLIEMLSKIYPGGISLPLQIEVSDNGKPYLANSSGIYFNLSHSKDMVACVISDKEVGIDIQYMGEYKKDIAKRFFTDDEQEYIENSSDKKLAFYEVWTKKEALLKCKGRGLGTMSEESVFLAQKNGYTFTNCCIDNYMLSTCV